MQKLTLLGLTLSSRSSWKGLALLTVRIATIERDPDAALHGSSQQQPPSFGPVGNQYPAIATSGYRTRSGS